jgi:hypothetical protein
MFLVKRMVIEILLNKDSQVFFLLKWVYNFKRKKT